MVRISQLAGALRLLQSTGRGLTEALPQGFSNNHQNSTRSQAWILSSIQAYSSSSNEPSPPSLPTSSPSGGESRLELPDPPTQTATNVTHSPLPPTKLPPGHIDFQKKELVMMYTCGKCDVRSAKAFSKQAYTSGVVIVECPGCGARHLVADHLGWFGSAGEDVETFAKERGHTVVTKKLAQGTIELTSEDVVGSAAFAKASTTTTIGDS